jgi:GPI-anchor transamidase subunit T
MENLSNSEFSIEEIFGRPIRGACPVSQSSELGQVHLQVFPFMKIDPPPTSFSNDKAHYTLTDQPFNFHVSFAQESTLPTPISPPLTVSRWLTGHGQERGGLQVLLTNTSPSQVEIVYLESLPWFMKPYLHTLKATVDARPIPLSTIRYRPAIDRLRGTQLEVQLSIPANTTLSLTWEFDKSILRYTEYPPDANRGFDVA